MSKRKKGRKRRHRRPGKKKQKKSTKISKSYREERPENIKKRDFKSQRRKQDLMFVVVMIVVGVSLISGYYMYETSWAPGDNNDNGGNNGLINNGNGDQKENAEIKWEHDYEKGLENARNSNKPVLIDFYTDWCVYCNDMDRDTYGDSRVIEKSSKFVCIKVDGDERSDIRDKYLINGYPSTIFLNIQHDETHRSDGYIAPGPFLEDMDFALDRAGT